MADHPSIQIHIERHIIPNIASDRHLITRECYIELEGGVLMPSALPTSEVLQHVRGPEERPGFDLPVYCSISC